MHIHGLEKESWLARLAKSCSCKRALPAERSRYSCDGPPPMLLGRRGACGGLGEAQSIDGSKL